MRGAAEMVSCWEEIWGFILFFFNQTNSFLRNKIMNVRDKKGSTSEMH